MLYGLCIKTIVMKMAITPNQKIHLLKTQKWQGLKLQDTEVNKGYTMWSNSIHTPEIYQSKTA